MCINREKEVVLGKIDLMFIMGNAMMREDRVILFEKHFVRGVNR